MKYKVTFLFDNNHTIECENIESDRGVYALHKAMTVLVNGWLGTTWPSQELRSVTIEEQVSDASSDTHL